MSSFETWYAELISNHIWFEPASLHHKPETFEKAARKVYMEYVADEIFPPIQSARKHVANVLGKINPDKPKAKPWYEQALEKQVKEAEEKEWVPVSEDERARRLKEFKALIDSMPLLNNFPRLTPKEKEENGEWIAAKANPYPVTSKEEYYVKLRHIEYIKANYEPKTGHKQPSWIEEDLWNVVYDEKHLTNQGK